MMTQKTIMEIISKAVIGILGTSMTISIVWMVSEVASLESLKTEITHVNKNMSKLNITAEKTNEQLSAFTKHHAQNLGILTKSIVINQTEIKNLKEDCEQYHLELSQCKDQIHSLGITDEQLKGWHANGK